MGNWKHLKAGDLVDVVAPGSAGKSEDIQTAVKTLESWGLRVRLNLAGQTSELPFLAHDDLSRWNNFKRALLAKDSKVIWCVRGGYGNLRLLPQLEKLKKAKQTKILIGYSDISTLIYFLSDKWKWVSCHGPLLETLASAKLEAKQIEELQDVLFGRLMHLSHQLKPLNSIATKSKSITGALTGGNLTVLTSQVGTYLQPKYKGKIVFFEDIGERGYRIDRMLTQLRLAGAFKGAEAVVFGDFTGGNESDGTNHVWLTIESWAKKQKIAVYSGLLSGHGKNNRAVMTGVKAVIKNSELTYPTGVKR